MARGRDKADLKPNEKNPGYPSAPRSIYPVQKKIKIAKRIESRMTSRQMTARNLRLTVLQTLVALLVSLATVISLPVLCAAYCGGGTGGTYTISASPASATAARQAASTKSRLTKKATATYRLFLDDRSTHLKRAALISLGRLDDRESLPGMMPKLADGNETVRTSAVLALGLSRCGKAHYTLLNLAQDTAYAQKLVDRKPTPPVMRGFAAAALALTDAMGAGSTLQNIAADKSCDNAVRAVALEGLGLLGDESSIHFLVEFTRQTKNDIRLTSAATVALGKTGDEIVFPVLLNLLASKHVVLQQSASIALGNVSPRGSKTAVNRLYRCFDRAGNASLKGHIGCSTTSTPPVPTKSR